MDLLNYKFESDFNQKHLLSLKNYSKEDILRVLSLALKLKGMQKKGQDHKYLKGQSLGMIFSKSSTRTRVSFEVGIQQLGGFALFLNSSDIQLGRGETIEDTAKVLSRYLDGIMIRTFDHKDLDDLAKFSSIPIINGLTDDYHPCQILADLLTIYEIKNRFKGLKLAYIGDGNNVFNSLLIGASKLGLDVLFAGPKGYKPSQKVIEEGRKNSLESDSKIKILEDPKEAISNADIVYTDVWTSMGQEEESKKRLKDFEGYQIDNSLFNLAKDDAVFLHCLPAHRGEEVAAEVIDGKNSFIYDQAENRLHVQKAIMALLMEKDKVFGG